MRVRCDGCRYLKEDGALSACTHPQVGDIYSLQEQRGERKVSIEAMNRLGIFADIAGVLVEEFSFPRWFHPRWLNSCQAYRKK